MYLTYCFRDLLPSKTSKVKVIEGSPNNIPDESAHRAALEIRDLANSLRESDIGLTLITGEKLLTHWFQVDLVLISKV